MLIPNINALGTPVLGRPVGAQIQQPQQQPANNLPVQEETSLPKAVNFIADQSGCGFWRVFWPSDQLNARMKSVVMSICQMVADERFFHSIKTVRIQRQATPPQLQYVKFLKQLSQKFGFQLVYEIDDVMFYEDIPEYNHFKPGFSNPEVRESSIEIMRLCDEITTTTPTIAEYYKLKTGNPNTTVIPNFIPKWWAGNFFDEKRISRYYDKNKKRPRVLYAGSGAHTDVDQRVKGRDDFEKINDSVRKTVNDFQWVFYGTLPRGLVDLAQSGKIEYHNWTKLYDYPEKLVSLKCQAMVAPLQDNMFNRCKSEIKITEANTLGLIPVCQNLDPYKKATYKFDDGDEMIDNLKESLKNKDLFMKQIRKGRVNGESMFLENPDNIGMWEELYAGHKFATPERKRINKFNNISTIELPK